MQLKDTPRTGEADQLNLLKKGMLRKFWIFQGRFLALSKKLVRI